MSNAFHWNWRKFRRFIEEDSAVDVLIMLSMHVNARNRCWPTIGTLAEEIGCARGTVEKGKSWLLAHKAIEIVPYDERSGDTEKKLSPNRHIYQLTGIIEVNGKTYDYWHLPPQTDNSSENDKSENDKSYFDPKDIDHNTEGDLKDSQSDSAPTGSGVNSLELQCISLYNRVVERIEGFDRSDKGLPASKVALESERHIATISERYAEHAAAGTWADCLKWLQVLHTRYDKEHEKTIRGARASNLPAPDRPKMTGDDPEKAKRPAINDSLKEAIAVHLQLLKPELATRYTGILASIAAAKCKTAWGIDKLTAENYQAVANGIPAFVLWFQKECPGCALPTARDTFETRYAQWISNGSPDHREVSPTAETQSAEPYEYNDEPLGTGRPLR